MAYPKFIVTSGGCLRMGMVQMHKELLQMGERCTGGGFYAFDYSGLRLVLSGESMDYGKPQWHRLSTLYIPREYEGFTPVYKTYSGEEIILAEILTVKYV